MMNIKKSVPLTIILIISILLIGCSEKQENPEDMVENYIKAMKNFDLNGMGEYVLQEDMKEELGKDIEDFEQEVLFKYCKENAKKIEYKILESDIKDDKGQVKVKFKYVDGTELIGNTIQEYLGEALIFAFSGKDMDDERAQEIFESIFNKELENEDIRFVEREIDIPVEMKDNKWYISDVSDKLLDVAMCNAISIFSEFEDE